MTNYEAQGSGLRAQGSYPEPPAISPEPVEKIVEILLARSAIYHALSVALRRPDPDAAAWLARREHHRLPELLSLLGYADDSAVMLAMRRMVEALDRVPPSTRAQEHDRIFGHAVQSAAPPYELEYGEAHSHRQPQELGDIAAFYHAFGLQASSSAHERVDHLATECEFLQFLLYQHAGALDEGHEEHAATCEAAVRRFLADHLGRWAPAFAVRLLRAGGDGVLGAVANALLEWVAQECARLQVACGSQELPLRVPQEADDISCAACPSAEPAGAHAAEAARSGDDGCAAV